MESTNRRFFIPPGKIHGPNPSIEGEEARHLTQVLRMKVGDEVVLFDNSNQEYRARIQALSGNKVFFAIIKHQAVERESKIQLTLGMPLIRSQPFEWVLQKGTELGVTSFRPFYSAHSRRNFEKEEMTSRMKRWERIVIEAAKQCRRNILPEIIPAVPFPDLLQPGAEALKIISYEGEASRTLKTLDGNASFSNRVLVLVGPEGGFLRDEVIEAEAKGFVPVSLGPRIVRSETAALALIALCQFLWGDMGSTIKGGEYALP